MLTQCQPASIKKLINNWANHCGTCKQQENTVPRYFMNIFLIWITLFLLPVPNVFYGNLVRVIVITTIIVYYNRIKTSFFPPSVLSRPLIYVGPRYNRFFVPSCNENGA